MSRIEDKLQKNKAIVADGLKKRIFDWVAAIIVVALIAASLDIFGLIEFNTINFAEFVISWFPYFAAAILLNTDLYKKGVFVGKSTNKFISAVNSYGDIADSLSGSQIKNLYPFCETYNYEAKKNIQTQVLRKEGLTFEDFEFGTTEVKPLKVLDKNELVELGYTKQQIRCIRRAKRVYVRGINVNLLLSTMDVKDVTNIGSDEHHLESKRIMSSAIRYMLSTFLLSVIAIKNVTYWGWTGLILTLFKVVYLFAGCCMSYFKGYDDVTTNLVNHFTRKSDILKMYLNYVPETKEIENEDIDDTVK